MNNHKLYGTLYIENKTVLEGDNEKIKKAIEMECKGLAVDLYNKYLEYKADGFKEFSEEK